MTVIGVAWQGTEEQMQGFIDDHALTFPQINDEPGAVFERFGVPAQPAWVFIAPDGETQALLGAADEALLDRVLTGLLA